MLASRGDSLNAKDNFEFDRTGEDPAERGSALTSVIYGSTIMTYAASHRAGTCRTTQSCFRVAAGWAFTGRAAERLAAAMGISQRQAHRYLEQARRLKAPVPAVEAKGRVHGETATVVGGAPPPVRGGDRRETQRNRQSSLVGHASARGRAWLTASAQAAMKFEGSLARSACGRKSWPKPISCWCRNVPPRRPGA